MHCILYVDVCRSVENIGISVVYGINYFGRGILSQPNYIKYIKHDVLGADYLNSSLEFASTAKQYYAMISEKIETYGEIQRM